MTTRNFAGVNSSFNRETTSHRIANILENGILKSVSYDSRGNLTSDALSNWTTYEFNRSNLPLYLNSGNKSYRFGYNDKGERITKYFEDDSTETTEKYLLDYLGRTLVVYNNRNMEGIINGNGLIGSISVTDSSTNYYYFLKDHLGNIRTTLDANGTVKTARDFGPYGETLREYSAEETVDRFQYTEKERDKESRDTYFGARYLSGYFPFWKSVDPLAEKYPGWSPYSYALGNPMRFVDPKGMEAEEDDEQKKKDELYEWLSSGHEGFPGDNGNNKKQATVPGTERNKIDQPAALEIINQLGKEFQDAFKKSGLSATEFLAEASGKYSSITNAAGVTSALTPGLQEFTPVLFGASKISGALNIGSQLANIALGGHSYSKEDLAISLTQFLTLGSMKVSKASETSKEAVDFIFRLFGIGNDLNKVIQNKK